MVFIIYIFLWCISIRLINTSTVIVNNEDELKNTLSYLNNTSTDELIINVNNVKIDLLENFQIEGSVGKLSIIGKSKNSSILNFEDTNNGIIYTNLVYDKTQEIKFANITIRGHLELYRIVNVIFEDVNIDGSILFDKEFNYIWGDYISNGSEYLMNIVDITISMSKMIYNAIGYKNEYCIRLIGDVIINDSQFYGDGSCGETIIEYYGEDLYTMDVSNIYFNGMYKNNCFFLYSVPLATFYSSTFENGVATNYGG